MALSQESLTASVEDILREELNPTVIDMLPQADPIFSKVISTSMNVTSAGIGRGYQVKQVFAASVAGGMKWVDPSGGSTSTTVGPGGSGTDLQHSYQLADQQSFPSVSETSMVGTVVQTLGMAEAFGNFFLPKKYLETDQLDAAITSAIRMNIEGCARLVAHHQAYCFYANTDGRLGVATALAVATNVATISGITGGRARYFKPGMHLDAYTSGGSQINAAFDLVVESVDYIGATIGTPVIKVYSPDQADITGAGWDTSGAGSDIWYPKDTYNATRRLPFGLQDWMKASGTLFTSGSGISLATHPEFKSLVKAVSASLTESVLNLYLGIYIDAYGGDVAPIDTLITTRLVTGEYVDAPKWSYGSTGVLSDSTQGGNMTMDRQGKAVTMKGGWISASYVYEGKSFNWYISPFCPDGYLFGIKLGDGNIKRYVPPAAPGAGSDSQFPGDVKFFAPIAGYKGIFAAVTADGGGLSPLVQAPFSLMCQNIPTDPRGLLLTGLTDLS